MVVPYSETHMIADSYSLDQQFLPFFFFFFILVAVFFLKARQNFCHLSEEDIKNIGPDLGRWVTSGPMQMILEVYNSEWAIFGFMPVFW